MWMEHPSLIEHNDQIPQDVPLIISSQACAANYSNIGNLILVLVSGGFYINSLKLTMPFHTRAYIHLKLQAGRPGLPPLKCTGSSKQLAVDLGV